MTDENTTNTREGGLNRPTMSFSTGTAAVRRVITLSGEGRVFRLSKERLVVGSVVSADVRLSGAGVAPIHAVIELYDPEVEGDRMASSPVIFDLASETGVLINGKPAVVAKLSAGDHIQIGPHILEVSIGVRQSGKASSGSSVQGKGGESLGAAQTGSDFVGRLGDKAEDVAALLLEDERDVYPIFDYRPAEKKALEAVMSWRGSILNVEHFVKERSVWIGESRENDFALPPLLSSKKFALVERKKDGFILNLDDQMKGVVQRRGKLLSLVDLRRATTVGGPTQDVVLEADDFAKVTVGEVDFYLSFTDAPPRLKVPRLLDRDPLFLKIFLISMGLTASMLGYLLNAPVPLNVEVEPIPERLATILYNPEKYYAMKSVVVPTVNSKTTGAEKTTPIAVKPEKIRPETPKAEKPKPEAPKPVPKVKVEITPHPVATPKVPPKEMTVGKQAGPKVPQEKAKIGAVAKKGGGSAHAQNEAKEGAGARAKGPEGTRGQPKAPAHTEHQDRAQRPGGGSGGAGKIIGDSQVQDIGNVDILNTATAKITDILGNSAGKLGKSGEKLKGFGAFTTQGSGGLALSGSGTGGGGTADTTLGGLSDHGKGGGLIGTGKGAAGNGTGFVGGKVRVAIKSGGPEEAVVVGSIDSDAIEAAMRAHYDEFRLCYEKEVNAENPDLAGRVGTTFVIGSTGRVNQAGITSTTLNNANTERCILNVIRRIDFPIPRGGGEVQVTYPFKFNRTGK